MERKLIGSILIDKTKYTIYLNEDGTTTKEKESNYIYNEENINIYNEST